MYLIPKNYSSVPATPQAATMEELLLQVPHKQIADQIRLKWGTADADEYMNSLLINTRENCRQGFSSEVSRALFTLITLNELARRQTGASAEMDTISGCDWVNETGKWNIVKSRDRNKLAAGADVSTPGFESTNFRSALRRGQRET
jgi:hypothetical protein